MPETGLNPKQRLFVGLVAQGRSARDAYKKAYGVADNGIASAAGTRLLKNVKALTALRELHGQITEKTLVSVENLTKDLFELRDQAKQDGQISAAVAALALIARMHGFITDRSQVDIVHHKPAKEPAMKDLELSEDEWVRLYKPQQAS